MGDGADAAAAPPARLSVGRDADRARDVGRPAVAGLDQPVVVAGGEEDHRLAGRRVDHLADVGHHPRASRKRSQVDRLQVGEEGVVAADQHHRLVGLDLVALVQRLHLQLRPAVLPGAPLAPPRAFAQDRDRLVDPAEQPMVLGEALHRHLRSPPFGFQQLLGEDEIGVRVVAGADFLQRQAEGRRRLAPFPVARRLGGHLREPRRAQISGPGGLGSGGSFGGVGTGGVGSGPGTSGGSGAGGTGSGPGGVGLGSGAGGTGGPGSGAGLGGLGSGTGPGGAGAGGAGVSRVGVGLGLGMGRDYPRPCWVIRGDGRDADTRGQ